MCKLTEAAFLHNQCKTLRIHSGILNFLTSACYIIYCSLVRVQPVSILLPKTKKQKQKQKTLKLLLNNLM